MALKVEDGSIVEDAESYASVSEADTYNTNRANSGWANLGQTEKEAALRVATEWLDGRYNWRGQIKDLEQDLDWPRTWAYDDEDRLLEGIPKKLKQACMQLAYEHTQASLTEAEGPRVTSERVEGAVEVEYADTAGNQGNRFPVVERMLRGLHNGSSGGSTVKLERA